MDKIIEKKKGWRSAFTKKAMPYWLGAIVVVFVLYLVFRDNSNNLNLSIQLSRTSTDNQLFPRRGSEFMASVTVVLYTIHIE